MARFNNERMEILRKSAGMTLSDLSDKLDLTDTAVANWEKGRAEPRPMHLKMLGEALGVSPEELLITTNHTEG